MLPSPSRPDFARDVGSNGKNNSLLIKYWDLTHLPKIPRIRLADSLEKKNICHFRDWREGSLGTFFRGVIEWWLSHIWMSQGLNMDSKASPYAKKTSQSGHIRTSTDEIKWLGLDEIEVGSGHVEVSISASLHDNLTTRLFTVTMSQQRLHHTQTFSTTLCFRKFEAISRTCWLMLFLCVFLWR